MGVSDIIQNIFEDLSFAIVSILDNTKKLVFNLGSATSGKTMTIQSAHTDDRVITLPDRNGTLETVEADREQLLFDYFDYSKSDILVINMTHSFTIGINNPVQGKTALLVVDPNSFTLSLPATAKIVSGRFKNNTRNYVYFHCIDGVTPEYVVTIGQQLA